MTPEEKAKLDFYKSKFEQQQAAQSAVALTPEEQAKLDFYKSKFELNPEAEEASLGIARRAQYALEPLESNRLAFLQQEYGAENVKTDESGNTYIKQGDRFLPVNTEGISTADFADVLATAPEMVGVGVGGALGLATTGGAATPAGVAGGAAIGSAARQALSAGLGTPQVAGLGERAADIAISATLSGVGAGIGKAARGVSKKLFPKVKVDKQFKNLTKELKLKPENITLGIEQGGEKLAKEKGTGYTPYFGRKIRKAYNENVQQLKKNLTDAFGEFSDLDADRVTIGAAVKDRALETNRATKELASSLFDEISSVGNNVTIPTKDFGESLVKNMSKLQLFDQSGRPLKHSVRSKLTESQFKRLQSIGQRLLEMTDDLAAQDAQQIGGGVRGITANDLNTMRKFIDENITEGARDNVSNYGLKKLRESFLNITEDMLEAENPELKVKFGAARKLWKKYLDDKEIIEKAKGLNLSNLSDEAVLDRVFRDTKSLKKFEQIVPKETVEEMGGKYVNELLRKYIGKEGKATSQAAINNIRKRREVIKSAIGKKQYNTLIKNLEFMQRIGEPINPSGTALVDLRTNLLKGAIGRAGQKAEASAVRSLRNAPEVGGRLSQSLFDRLSGNYPQNQVSIPYRQGNESKK